MKKKLIWMPLASLLFLGCTKTIKINDRREVLPTKHVIYEEEPVIYEEVTRYEPRDITESRVVVPNEVPYVEEVSYTEETAPIEKVPPIKKVPHIEELSHVAETPPVSVVTTKPFNIAPLDVFDKILENPNVLVLDVRLVKEIPKDGKIANSVLIPLQVLGQNLNRLDKSKEIIVYCHTGNRSVRATKLLRENGFDAINMVGGIEAWKRDHLAVKWK